MWETSQGERTLVGAEAEMIRCVVGQLWDTITIGIDIKEPHVTDVTLFNGLEPNQQLAAIHEVTKALLVPSVPIPARTAIGEATIHTIYRELIGLVQIEIDFSRYEGELDVHLRSMVLDTFHQRQAEQPGQMSCDDDWLPAVDCDEIDAWEFLVELLADQILFDRDFEMEAILIDQAPEKTKLLKRVLGVQKDYFTAIAPDPNSAEFEEMEREMRQLIGMEPSF